MQKLLKLNNKTITNMDLLNLRHNHNYIGMETIKELNEDLRLCLVKLVNNNFFVVKVIREQ